MKLKLTFTQHEVYKMLLAKGPITLSHLREKLRYRMEKVRNAMKTLEKIGVAKSIGDDFYEAIPTILGIYIRSNTIPKSKYEKSKVKLIPVPDPLMRLNITDKQRQDIIANLPKIKSKEMKRTELAKLVNMRKMDLNQVLVFEFKVGS